ncbi:WXG100 family type VII secretion target [Herpetosiphon gulosus]|uniref:Protein glutaminase domain-containing protein n=1 Tax=Herpetosiphon gulosus TaxID=1973496 RepID=A0ABP9WV93_9CHLR
MSAPIVQIDYAIVDTIIQRFQKLHDQSQTIQSSLCQTMTALQAGQWQGSAANACFQEFEHVVNPAFQRLLHSLQGSVETTKAIRQIMADAEAEAAALFRGDFGAMAVGGNGSMFAQVVDGEVRSKSTPTPTPPSDKSLLPPFFQKLIDFILQAVETWQNDRADGVQVNQDGSVSYADATLIFDDMTNEPDIPFQFPYDGCYARAYLMGNRMVERYAFNQEHISKVFIFDTALGDGLNELRIDQQFQYDGFEPVEWDYHVAPSIMVRDAQGNLQPMIIDPSLFDHPVTIEEWKQSMNFPNATIDIRGFSWYAPNWEVTPENQAQTDAITQERMQTYMDVCKEEGYCQ